MKKNSINKNFFYNFLYEIVIILSPLIMTPYLSNVLGVELIGVRSYTFAILIYFELFANLGIAIYGQREIAKVKDDKEKRSQIFINLMITKLILFLIVFIIYCLAFFKFNYLSEYRLVWFIFIIHFLEALFNVVWYFKGREKFKLISIRGIILRIMQIILTLLLIKKPSDFYLYLIIYSLTPLLQAITLWIFLFKEITVKKIEFKVLRHLKNIFIFFIPTIAITIYSNVDKIMLSSILKESTQTGFYELAHSIAILASTIFASIYAVMISKISSELNSKNHYNLKYFVKIAIMMTSSITLGLLAISDEFIYSFYGINFLYVSQLLKVLTAVVFLMGISGFINSVYIIPYNKQKYINYFYIVATIVNVILNFVFIPKYHALGAIISSIIAELIVFVGCLYISKNYINLKFYFINTWKFIVSAIVMFIILSLIKLDFTMFNLMLKIIVGMFVYLCSLIILKEELVVGHRNNISLYGWFGSENVGDDALLNQTVKLIRDKNKNSIISLLANTDDKIYNKDISCVMKKSGVNFLKSLLTNNTFIFGPGGLFPSKNTKKLLFMLIYMTIIRLLNKKLLFLGIGIENCNFSSKIDRIIVKLILLLTNKTTIRYDNSIYDNQKNLPKKVVSSTDVMYTKQYKNYGKSEKYILVSLANIFENSRDKDKFIKDILPLFKEMINDGYELKFISFTRNKDDKLNHEIIKLLKNNCHNISYTSDLEEVYKYFSKAYMVVGMRFHSVVFSTNYEVPFLPISYSSKIEELLYEFNMLNLSNKICYTKTKYFCNIIDLDTKKIIDTYLYLKKNHKTVKLNIRDKLVKVRDKSLKNIEMLDKYL